MVVIRPAGALEDELPVCVALHGRGSDARMIVQLGVEKLLATAPTPFAMVGLDGGNSYWVAKESSDDPQRMLTDELPGWLAERHLAPTPFAVFGLSMGAYGALNYARRSPHPVVRRSAPPCSAAGRTRGPETSSRTRSGGRRPTRSSTSTRSVTPRWVSGAARRTRSTRPPVSLST
jgi:pimeloyl-ACP methyl ester carboxylesterase